ncbi:hypothetical protein ACFL6I_17080 [candidate division KSB1 bacterium]
MKKAIIIGMIIALVLLVACQPKQTTEPETIPAETSADDSTATEQVGPSEGSDTTGEIPSDVNYDMPEAEQPETQEDTAPEVDITQEDLDELEKELQGMDFEDLEGLS